ncbi:hypothetical protein PHYPSEUDO_012375 [Phytophthora pseudosyringae]|uniref:Uncharacterized protein n=1 Tax=Phytophthora pseudosyringae TaxID=221518 RepID=A0A8T1VBQ7_9STRA|nr:hypothetical protein PHYPSEUDO_012375 [Phytophthora pseudosyringae]
MWTTIASQDELGELKPSPPAPHEVPTCTSIVSLRERLDTGERKSENLDVSKRNGDAMTDEMLRGEILDDEETKSETHEVTEQDGGAHSDVTERGGDATAKELFREDKLG